MGKPQSLLEGLCGHALSLGANSIGVEYKDGRQWVFANKGTADMGVGISIANYERASTDEEELRENLYAAVKKAPRAVFDGKVYLLKTRSFEDFGEDAFEVRIDPAPKLDPSAPPSFTAKQGQYLAFIHNYTKINRQAPAQADLQSYFQVTAAAVHDMIKALERNGLIEKVPGRARSIRLCVNPENLPRLG